MSINRCCRYSKEALTILWQYLVKKLQLKRPLISWSRFTFSCIGSVSYKIWEYNTVPWYYTMSCISTCIIMYSRNFHLENIFVNCLMSSVIERDKLLWWPLPHLHKFRYFYNTKVAGLDKIKNFRLYGSISVFLGPNLWNCMCRVYSCFTMETILATAFGRRVDILRGESDELSKSINLLLRDSNEKEVFNFFVLLSKF